MVGSGYNTTMDALAQEITNFILSPPLTEGDAAFETLALALFARQYARIEPYRRLCDAQNLSPKTVTRWQGIPAVPAAAFKRFTLSAVPTENAAAVFHSSGTTGAQTSRHYFDRAGLTLYETSLRAGFDAALPTRPAPLWAMMPSPDASPHSSLSHMLGALGAERFFWDDDGALASALAGAESAITLFGTAFAFVSLFDETNSNFHLPPGSVVVETGGFKGRSREVPRAELYALFGTRLGIGADQCYSEYGMCEMASQFYGHGLNPEKRGPHWVRSRTIDPETGEDTKDGAAGLLRHYDLANFNSVQALQTQDVGVLTPDGFLLEGRAPDAEVRGCSLTVEELWTSRQA